MARSRTRRRSRRRTVGRSRSGRFVSATRRRRSRRSNPSGFIKVGRRWRKITKYARRRRRGGRKGQIRGFKFPRRYRRSRSRRRVRRNPVVMTNPPRHRRRRVRRNASRRRRHRVYRNPVARTLRLASDPIKAVKEAIMSAFSGDTLETLFHLGLGFGSVIPLSRLVIKNFVPQLGTTPYGRIGGTLGVTLIGTALAGLVTKDSKLTSRFMAGGMLATLWQGLTELLPAEAKAYIPTLGAPADDEFRRAIEKEVLKELRGGVSGYLPAAGAEGYSTYLQPAGIEYLQPAGQEAYLTETGIDRAEAGMGAYLTEVGAERAQAGLGGEDFDEFARASLPERF